MRRFLLLFAILLSGIPAINECFGQSESHSLNNRYGIMLDYNRNFHLADFSKLPGVPNCCPRFRTGSGNGFTFGGLFEMPLNDDFLLGIRLSYTNLDADLSEPETSWISVDSILTPAELKHDISGKLANIGIEPMINFRLFSDMFAHIGFRLGFVTVKSFSQVETISKPVNTGTFVDSLGRDLGTRTRNTASADIPQAASIYFAGLLGASYELPLNSKKDLMLVPEVFLNYGFNDIIPDTKWKASAFRVGLAVKYTPIPKENIIERFEKDEKIDSIIILSEKITKRFVVIGESKIKIEKIFEDNTILTIEHIRRTDTIFEPRIFQLSGTIDAVGLDSAGKEIRNPIITIEEFVSSRLQPLLNYIFFDENSSEIPPRYSKITKEKIPEFSEDKLFSYGTLPTYYEILNIIGSRMLKNPKSSLKIVGCNSDFGVEKGNKTLSENRAASVKEYLKSIWNIEDDRLEIEVRNLPEKPSTPLGEPEKNYENQRVELVSDDYELVQAIFTTDTLRKSSIPFIRFKPTSKTEAGLKAWEIGLLQNQIPVKKFQSNESIKHFIDWNLDENQPIHPLQLVPLDYRLVLTDMKNNEYSTDIKSIKINFVTLERKRSEHIADKEIDRYSLILFDFDKAEITGNNTKITNFIKSRLKPKSVVSIIGYSDQTGDDNYNMILSDKRAKTTAKALKLPDAIAFGKGEQELLYENNLPEGRFYCRAVNIMVETPIEK
ncbi:MAG: hypothetical protein HW421_2924 [Ignavibacteria bacterium]|nr:hypothetical protein [Ignavibacteria bacterium]